MVARDPGRVLTSLCVQLEGLLMKSQREMEDSFVHISMASVNIPCSEHVETRPQVSLKVQSRSFLQGQSWGQLFSNATETAAF